MAASAAWSVVIVEFASVEFCWAKAAAEKANNIAIASDARTKEFPPFKPRKIMQPPKSVWSGGNSALLIRGS
jgi:hypothetical protein